MGVLSRLALPDPSATGAGPIACFHRAQQELLLAVIASTQTVLITSKNADRDRAGLLKILSDANTLLGAGKNGDAVQKLTARRRNDRDHDDVAAAILASPSYEGTGAKNDTPRTFSSIRRRPPSDGTARAVQSARSHSRHVMPIGTAAAAFSMSRPSA